MLIIHNSYVDSIAKQRVYIRTWTHIDDIELDLTIVTDSGDITSIQTYNFKHGHHIPIGYSTKGLLYAIKENSV